MSKPALDRKSACAKKDLQRTSPTFAQKLREIFERRTPKTAIKLEGHILPVIDQKEPCLACHHYFTNNLNNQDITIEGNSCSGKVGPKMKLTTFKTF